MRARDWFVMVLTALLWVASTVYLFKHADDTNFQTWAALAVTVLSAYHWMVLHYQRRDS